MASESGFRVNPRENRKAFGITQITPSTLKIVQDPKGETKDFIFNKIRQKDLKDPTIAIPMGVRWLFRKRATAMSKLGRTPNHEEMILEYKGLLKSQTGLKNKAFQIYKEHHELLKKNEFTFSLLIPFLSGCATSSFRLVKQHELASELKVTPDAFCLNANSSTKMTPGMVTAL